MSELGRWYEPKETSTKLVVVRDRFQFVKTDDETRIDVIVDFQGLSDISRSVLANDEGLSLAEYDAALEEEEYDIRDRLDYYTYSTRVENLTVADGDWFSPNSVESFCGETAPNVATRAIDEDSTTFWRHGNNETHELIFKLRDYPKKIERIRFLYGAGESARERLNNITIRAAKGLANLDNPENELETDLNLVWPTGISSDTWVEHTLTNKKLKARYIKLIIGDTDNGQNQAQIREFEVWVGTRQPEDVDTE